MKKNILLILSLIILVGVPLWHSNKEISKLEKKISDLEIMALVGGAQADFYPFSGGLTGGGAGALDALTGTDNKDAAFVMLEADGTYGNAFFPYVLDVDGGGTESVPTIIDSGDGGNEDWELAIGVFNGVWSYGDIFGHIDIISDDNSLSTLQCKGSINKLNGAETTTLPEGLTGMSIILYSDDATVKTIDPTATDHIWLNGVDNGANNNIDSPGAVGDYIVLVCFSENNWYSIGQSGTWIDTP